VESHGSHAHACTPSTTLIKLQSLRARRSDGPLSKLVNLLEETPQDLQQAWTIIDSLVSKSEETGNRIMGCPSSLLGNLFQSTVSQWLVSRHDSLPSPLQAVALLDSIGKVEGDVLQEAMWALLVETLMDAKKRTRKKDELGKSLVDLWHYAVHRYDSLEQQSIEVNSSLERKWPAISPETFSQIDPQKARNGSARLKIMWPRIPVSEREALFTISVIIFCQSVSTGFCRMDNATKIFVSFAAVLLYKAHTWVCWQEIIQKLANSGSSFDKTACSKKLSDMHSHILIVLMASKSPLNTASSDIMGTPLALSLHEYFINNLGRMHERRIYSKFKQTWDLAHRTFALMPLHIGDGSTMTAPKSVLFPNDLYRMFLLTAFRMNSLKTALRIWNHMIATTGTPGLKDWTTMISGIGATKDMKAVDKLWQQMLDSGVKPDVAAWNARIQASINSGNFGDSMRVVNDMSDRWALERQNMVAYGNGHFDGHSKLVDNQPHSAGNGLDVTKPTTRTLNTILSAMRKSNPQSIPDILKWSDSMGIEHDTYTFNILLSKYKAQDDQPSFLGTFERMLTQNIKLDAVTYNMLNRFILHLPGKTIDEKRANILRLVEEMNRHGVEPTAQTYSPLLQALLSHGEVDAAKSLLNHAKQFGRSVHARLCAVMAKGIFEQPLPDMSVIEDMKREMMTERAGIGSDFYNAVLHGLAQAGHMQNMSNSMEAARLLGVTPTWTTLFTCLKACADALDRETAKKVVAYASQSSAHGSMESDGSAKPEMSKKYRDQFWQLVVRMELDPAISNH
jgi:pentatricopeptide repeat protein